MAHERNTTYTAMQNVKYTTQPGLNAFTYSTREVSMCSDSFLSKPHKVKNFSHAI